MRLNAYKTSIRNNLANSICREKTTFSPTFTPCINESEIVLAGGQWKLIVM